MKLDEFYIQTRGRRRYLLDLVDLELFTIDHDPGWFIEGLFKHILWNITALISYTGGEFDSDLVLKTDGKIKQYVGKSEVEYELEVADAKLLKQLDHIDENWLLDETKTYYGKTVTNEFQLFSILCHELEHHGQIRVILSILGDMSSSELYGLKK